MKYLCNTPNQNGCLKRAWNSTQKKAIKAMILSYEKMAKHFPSKARPLN